MLDCMKRSWSLFPSKLKVNTASHGPNSHLRILIYWAVDKTRNMEHSGTFRNMKKFLKF